MVRIRREVNRENMKGMEGKYWEREKEICKCRSKRVEKKKETV